MNTATETNAATPRTLVLLIEDEPALRDIYSTKMRMDGFEVIEASDGIEGFDAAIQRVPDVVLLDIMLPIKDGFEVLKDLKGNAKTQAVPVIILSNLGQEYEIKHGMALGASGFFIKANMTPSAIVDEVRKAVAKRGG